MRRPDDRCVCGHPFSSHTDWWDGSQFGHGCGFACTAADCECDDFEDLTEDARGYTRSDLLFGGNW